jgi:hypothetical protein
VIPIGYKKEKKEKRQDLSKSKMSGGVERAFHFEVMNIITKSKFSVLMKFCIRV